MRELSSMNDCGRQAGQFDRPLLLSARQDFFNYFIDLVSRVGLTIVSCVSILMVLLIFLFIIGEAWPFFRDHGVLEILGSKQWYPEAHPPHFGAVAIIAGSLYVTVCSLLLAVPIGILSAIFLSDIVGFHTRQILKPVIELLAAIPSVAYGFFAIMVLAPLLQNTFNLPTGTNALNASLILAIMATPTIVSVSQDALSAVPNDIRQAAYALGATRAEMLVKVVIPAGHSGIIAAVILGMMRALGETMVVWMASGNANQIPAPWWDITQSIRTMTATIAGDMGETAKGSAHYHSLFAVGTILLVFTFCLNMVSEFFLSKAKKIPGGEK